MIKVRATTSGGQPLAILGLSAANCRRLLDGEPIMIDTREPPPAGMAIEDGPLIVIMGGQTEADMEAELRTLLVMPS